MVLAARLDIGRRRHPPEVDRRAVDRQRAGLDQLVLAIELLEIGPVPVGGQVGGVAVPVQQVELRIILAEQIIVGDVAPDQVAAAQQVEGRRHIAPVEIALVGRKLADQLHLLVADEELEIAGLGEIDLGGEEGRRGDLVRLARAPRARRAPPPASSRRRNSRSRARPRRRAPREPRRSPRPRRGHNRPCVVSARLSSADFHETTKTVSPCSTAQRMKLFFGLRSRM